METANHESGAESIEDRIESLLGSDEEATEEAVEGDSHDFSDESDEHGLGDEHDELNESEEKDSEAEEESDDQEAEEETEDPGFQSIDELAEALEMSPDEFLEAIKGKVKIDGEESEISLAELRDGYQREADYRRKTMELGENRRAFEVEVEQYREQATQQHQQLANMVQIMESQVMQEFQQINWRELREFDPGEYAAKIQEYQQRKAQIDAVKQQGSQQFQQLQHEQQQVEAQKQQEFISKQAEALMDKLPEWKDNAVASKERGEIVDFLKSEYGYSPEEISGFVDHRLVLLARDALKARATDTKVEIAKAKVKNKPKLLKPGAKKGKAESRKAQQRSKLQGLRKRGGNTDAVADVLMDRI